jgi:thiol-disulfide isomerase/thioredoxin
MISFLKYPYIFLMLFLIPAVSFGQRTANLTGKIYSIPVNTVIHISSNRGFKDSVFTKDGTFRFDIPCDSVWDAYFIQFPDSLSTFSFPVLLKESSQISLKLNTKAQQYEISGDKNAEEQNDFWQGLVSLNAQLQTTQLKILDTKDSGKSVQLHEELNICQRQIDAYPNNWVTAHPSSPFSAAIIRMFIAGIRSYEDTVAEKYFDILFPIAKVNNYQAELLENQFALFNPKYKNVRLSLGSKMSEFVVKDTSGKDIRLCDFKDKYLLLDFWASWCAPCRENTPSIRWLYNKYKGNGLKVLSISLDKDNTKWKDAIKADTMSWLQGSDLMGEEGGVGFQFQIISIPQYVLLAPDGKIIFNFSNGDVDSLEEKLKQIFN